MPDEFRVICLKRSRPRAESCSFCKLPSTRLCDHPRPDRTGTCDKPLCIRHAVKIAIEVDYCPDHPRT